MLSARVRAMCAAAATALLFAGCASDNTAAPNWKPKPSFNGEGNPGGGNQQPDPEPNPQPTSPRSSASSGPPGKTDSAVVATHLAAPTGIAIMPDNTALVGERTTGRIVRVQPQPGQPVQTVRTLKGLDTSGDGGLLDLALSPNYAEDNLIFAYVSTKHDNRVVAFTLKGPVTSVLKGIPRGTTGNTGRIAFTGDGDLLVGTGDAGRPRAAVRPNSLAGKVLRVTDIGRAAPDNPVPGSRVYASGFKQSDGLCTDPQDSTAFQTESLDTATAPDPVNLVSAGDSFGWPLGSIADISPIATLPDNAAAPGGCAVLEHVLYTTSLDGKALLAARLRPVGHGQFALSAFQASLKNKYGRLRTVVAASDGALWLTTSNRDGNGTPIAADERVLRIVPSGGGGDSTA